jgi:hypothetical protein
MVSASVFVIGWRSEDGVARQLVPYEVLALVKQLLPSVFCMRQVCQAVDAEPVDRAEHPPPRRRQRVVVIPRRGRCSVFHVHICMFSLGDAVNYPRRRYCCQSAIFAELGIGQLSHKSTVLPYMRGSTDGIAARFASCDTAHLQRAGFPGLLPIVRETFAAEPRR